MSSWLTSLSEQAASLTQSAVKATENLKIDSDMLQKLTLSSPELIEERQKIDQEERRKEAVREKLSGLLPWETRDPDRDILVPECKEVILKMTADEQTFLGPWQMPEKNVTLDETPSSGSKDEATEDEEDGLEIKKQGSKDSPMPSKDSLEKLAKLEPLPVLLQHFDLDSHVGLIQRVLEVDTNLVKMQSKLSGGGARESIFWKNYFFNCAFSRYEAGLSVDEIWSEEAIVKNDEERRMAKEEAAKQTTAEKIKAAAAGLLGTKGSKDEDATVSAVQSQTEENEEHEISFGEGQADTVETPVVVLPPPSTEGEIQKETAAVAHATPTTEEAHDAVEDTKGRDDASPSTVASFDMVPDDDDFGDLDHDDPELDALEAEIAEALED